MLEQHLEKLNSFYCAAQEQNLLKASIRLKITQPAISKNIKFLEELLKTQLFIRHRRGMELSKSGLELFKFCESLFQRLKDVEHKVQNPGNLTGVIRIGTYETLGESFWPKALAKLKIKLPELKVELSTTNSEKQMWEHLNSAVIDLVVDAEPAVSESYTSMVLYKDHFSAFYTKKLKLDGEKIPFSFVRRAWDRQGQGIEDHLRRLDVPFELRYDVESFTMARSLSKEGLCISVLPQSLGQSSGLELFKYKDQALSFGEHRICVSFQNEMKNDPRLKAIVSILKEIL